jgi:general secretion pathway protein G
MTRRTRTPLTRRARRAFSLIELLLVLVILAILSGLVLMNFTGQSEKARQKAAGVDIKTIGAALDRFETDNGRYPTTDEGLGSLINPPANAKDPTNWPYLKEQSSVPNDPWGHPYQYRSPGTANPRGYDLFSMGTDGREGGGDDIDNWSPK